jgi:endonuclease/exonuclease/phosphatase family metal-dependent hydrolase
VILTGDFNVLPDSVVRKSVLRFEGCGEKLADVTEGVGMTFHGYHPEKHSEGDQIDYIFTNMKCDVSKSFTAKDFEDGVYLSDHYPVGAFLEI